MAEIVRSERFDTYEVVAQKAEAVRSVLARRGIKLSTGSALSQFLAQADKLSQAWDVQSTPDIRIAWEAAFVNRLADAVLNLPMGPVTQEALKRIAGSVVQPDDRTLSPGKDVLWELVLLSDLQASGLRVTAAEPDLLVDFGMGDYPIACKKIWSLNGVGKRVSHAGKQLAPFQNGGVIALNLDDLTPVGEVVSFPTAVEGEAFLQGFNQAFCKRHLSILESATKLGKCDGFIISTTAFAILSEEETSTNLITQSLMWYSSNSSPEAINRFRAFHNARRR